MAQLFEHLTLDFGLDHELTICETHPCVRLCADSMEPAWGPPSLSLSLSLSASPLLSLSLSLCPSPTCVLTPSALPLSVKINK